MSATLLVVEDNLVNQKLILTMVRKLGYDVDLVRDGQEAIEAVRAKQYAIILMDCQMPFLDGFQATTEIRKRFPADRLPIIAVTAHNMPGDREKCLAVGMNDYLAKPYGRPQLQEVIERWLVQTDSVA